MTDGGVDHAVELAGSIAVLQFGCQNPARRRIDDRRSSGSDGGAADPGRQQRLVPSSAALADLILPGVAEAKREHCDREFSSVPVPDAVAAMRCWVALRYPTMLLRFHRRLGYWPDAAWPRTHNERMLWRKIFDRNPEFVAFSDKVSAKALMAERCPQLRQARLLWVGSDADAVPQSVIDGDAMLKFNKGSGTNLVVRAGVPDRAEVVRRMRRWLRKGRRREEWGYWPIAPRLLAEELLGLGGSGLPTDIKVHVCGREVTHLWAVDKATGASITLDSGGQEIDGWAAGYELALPWSERVAELAREAARLAPHLAAGFDYLRVDFLVGEEGLRAGEMTFYPAAGFDSWYNAEMAGRLEASWDIRQSHYVRTGRGPYADALRDRWRP